ncbi:MAG: RNA polymerase sigma factor [Planctomycetota bacterium]|jgi:RNA polymerase sigma-70 factor (ECF subfamily)
MTETKPLVTSRGDSSDKDDAEAELVRKARAGDRAAFEVLVRRYLRLAGAAAYKVVGDYEQAADVVQDAFMKVHKSLHTLRDDRRFKSWLYGVVRTTAIDALRRRKRRGGRSVDVDTVSEELSVRPDPSAGLVDQERRVKVRAAVNELSEGYREIVVLKYLEDRSYQEIAEILDTTVEAVESKLHRARVKLKSKLASFARQTS